MKHLLHESEQGSETLQAQPQFWKGSSVEQLPSEDYSSERRCLLLSLWLFPIKNHWERRVKILAVWAEGEFKNFSDLSHGSGNKQQRKQQASSEMNRYFLSAAKLHHDHH